MRSARRGAAGLLALTLASLVRCSHAPPGPAVLDTRHEACAFCRMAVSERRFAAQLVAAGEEPRFFDDIGCLGGYVRAQHGRLARGSRAYVVDHRTGAWLRAAQAVYTRLPQLQTPMGSHVVAHADEASRRADPQTADARTPLDPALLFGPDGAPDGAPDRAPTGTPR